MAAKPKMPRVKSGTHFRTPEAPSEALRSALWIAMAKGRTTRWRVADDAGVAYSAVHRFMTRERGLTLETFDRLCVSLGFVLKREGTPRRLEREPGATRAKGRNPS